MALETHGATVAQFERALLAITTRFFDTAPSPEPDLSASTAHARSAERAMAVAFSGGLDSSVLLQLAHDFAMSHDIRLYAFHVHHALSDQANAWLSHCQLQAMQRAVTFDVRYIAVVQNGEGIEAAARKGRYAALGEMCRHHHVPLLLTAHHQDDQAETVMLQLLRGSGVAGLSGMDSVNHAPVLLGDPLTMMGRPLLNVSRAALQVVACAHSVAHIEDPSNHDPRFARNALRHRIMPSLEEAFPGFAQRFARTAHHAQSAQQLLIELGEHDLAQCLDGKSIDLDQLRLLSPARCDNLLRYWFGSCGMRMPSTAWLHEMREQLFDAKADAQILIGHADCDIHRHRNRIVMTPRRPLPDPEQDSQHFAWNGASHMDFPDFGGSLHFDVAEQGFDVVWLQAQMLTMQWRSGGWRLKLAPNRATRSLKYHYQAVDVPAWERAHLPLVTLNTALLYAAGVGMDCHHFSQENGTRIALRWQAG